MFDMDDRDDGLVPVLSRQIFANLIIDMPLLR